MAKKEFKSLWGGLQVANITPAQPDTDDPDKSSNPADAGEEVIEDEDDGNEGSSTVNQESGEVEEAGGDDQGTTTDEGDEYEFTDDDVSKAYTMLLEQGVIDEIEDEEAFEAKPESLADVVAVTVRKKVQETLSQTPEVVQKFYQHVTAGNDPKDFKIADDAIVWSDVDLSEEANQISALQSSLRLQGFNEEDIAEEVEDAKTSGRLEKKAIAAKTVLSKRQETEEAAKAQQTAKAQEKAQKEAEAAEQKVRKSIDDMDEMAGFKLDAKRKEEFKKYIFDIDKRTGKTRMQQNMSDQERIIRIAFLDFIDYNSDDVKKELKTSLTKTRRKNLTKYTDKNVKNSQSSRTVSSNKDNKGKLIIPSIFGGKNIETED